MKRRTTWKPQFRISWILWLTLVVASFFAGRQWQIEHSESHPIRVMHGTGLNSDSGLTAIVVVD